MTFSVTRRKSEYIYEDRIHSTKCIEVAYHKIKNDERILYVLGVGGAVKHRVQYGFCDHIRYQLQTINLAGIRRNNRLFLRRG
jgi:hypothetical protein